MRKTSFVISFISIVFFGFLITDNRDDYTGNYLCQKTCSKMDVNSKNLVTTNETVTVEITKDAADSVLQIKINSDILKVKLINKDLKPFLPSSRYGGNFFSTDSLNFILSRGRAESCRYLGKKQ